MSERNYGHHYGYHAHSNWGTGGDVSDYGEGDVVWVPGTATEGRIPHSWSRNPHLNAVPGRFRVIAVYSIDEGPSWYYRVAPIVDRKTMWDEVSDRLHVIPGTCDYTKGFRLLRKAPVR